MSDIMELTKEQEEFVLEFTDKLHEFICNSEDDELGYDYPTLIQEVVGFSVYYAYLHAENPDQVTFALGKLKQLAIKDRLNNEEGEIH